MSPRDILRIAKPLRAAIGAHYRLIGDSNVCHEDYQRARAESDLAVQRAKYLIQHLQNRHDAVMLARAVGMDGYINMR